VELTDESDASEDCARQSGTGTIARARWRVVFRTEALDPTRSSCGSGNPQHVADHDALGTTLSNRDPIDILMRRIPINWHPQHHETSSFIHPFSRRPKPLDVPVVRGWSVDLEVASQCPRWRFGLSSLCCDCSGENLPTLTQNRFQGIASPNTSR
jgi:hypothetical protein